MKNSEFQHSDFLDILFYKRNKKYGAYELRKRYKFRARKALLICLALVMVGSLVSMTINTDLPTLVLEVPTDGPTILTKIYDEELVPILATPAQEERVEVKQDIELPPEIVENVIDVPKESPRVDPQPNSAPQANPGSTSHSGPVASGPIASTSRAGSARGQGLTKIAPVDTMPAPEPEPQPTPEPLDEVIDETIADVLPQFPGGFSKLKAFLQKNIDYPKLEQARRLEGKVMVNFVVDKNGELEEVKVVRRSSLGFNDAALKVMRKMPRWKPGSKGGKKAKVRLTLPIEFILE